MRRHSDETKEAALDLYNKGLTAEQVAAELGNGIARSTVQLWVNHALIGQTNGETVQVAYQGKWVRDGLIWRAA